MSEVKVPFVDLKAQYQSIKVEIDRVMLSALEGAQFVGGELVSSFEQKFGKYLDVPHCITCGNGTDALEMVLNALEIGSGDEVIVPANSWISTAEAVTHVGAEPVFVDVLTDEYSMDPGLLEKAISTKTKCLIPVHLTGLPARMPEILTIAETYGLWVVEDGAQAHGATINGRKVGTFGIAGTFSFYPSKNLGAYGDGGCIVTHDDQLAEKLRRIGNHGQLHKHDHFFAGRNSRLDSLQAALLEVKLQYLDQWNQQRNEVANWYNQYLSPEILRPIVPDGYVHPFHLYMIRIPERDLLRESLSKKGILTGIHYPKPIPFTQAYQYLGHQTGDFPVAVALSKEILSLPMYPELTENQVRYVSKVVNEHLNQVR